MLMPLPPLHKTPGQVKQEGTSALYVGLSAALARQASYTTLRLGLYDLMKQLVIDCKLLLIRSCEH